MALGVENIAAVVLDRDGTIIEDRHYIRRPEDVVFLPGAVDALARIRSKGYALLLASNQSGVGRGLITESEFQSVHTRFEQVLSEHGVVFDHYGYCFHTPSDACPCRKPKAAMVPSVLGGRSILWDASFVVGDHLPDLGLATTLGATACLVLTGKGVVTRQEPCAVGAQVFESISEFASFVPPSVLAKRF